MLTNFSKQNKNSQTETTSQQQKNQTIIPRHLNRVWPRWVYLQSSPTSKLFNLHENPDAWINVSQRNWVYLTAPGSDYTIQLDSHGLLTSHAQPWSLDVWAAKNGSVISPSHLDSVKQQFDSHIPSLTTTFTAYDVVISAEAFIIPLPHGEHVACQIITLTNPAPAPISLSCCVALRPYTPEGLGAIHNITYHSQNAFLINARLALVCDKKPDNIICLPFNEGDCSEHLQRWEMVLQTSCKQELASAVAEYRLTLTPGEKKELTFKIPLHNSPAPSHNKAKLDTTISQLQSLNAESEKNRIGKLWKEALPLCELSLPDPNVQTLIQKNLLHLVSHSDTYTHKHAIELLHILSVQSLFSANFEAEKQFKNAFQALDKTHLYELSLYTLALLDYAEKNPENLWVKKHFLNLMPHWTLLIKHLEAKQKKTAPQSEPTRTLFLAIAATKKAGKFSSHLKQTIEISASLLHMASKLSKGIHSLSERLEKTIVFRPIIPISETEWTDARLIDALCGVTLHLLDPHSAQVTETLRWLETHSLVNNTVLFNQTDPTGLCTHQNARLAQIYVARKDPKAWPLLNWLIQTASPAGTWPGAFHPLYLVGCDGEGHSRETMVEFLKLIRSCLISEDEKTLHITPFIPKTWLEKGLSIRFKNIPTIFGELSLETKHIGTTIDYSFSTRFYTQPELIKISLPTSLSEASCKGKAIPFQENTAFLPGTETECRLTLMAQ